MQPEQCFCQTGCGCNMDKIMKMPEAQALIQLLKRQSKETMDEVMKSINTGNYEKAKTLLQPTIDNKEFQEALQKVGSKIG